MARNEQKFIDKLSDFTNALGDLVDILGEEYKKNPSESTNKLTDSFDGDLLKSIADDVAKLKEDTSATRKDTSEILKAVKEQKKKEETGMFGSVDDKSNQDKIIGAVKTVVLIAAGVLAIGMAFKIVGDVDFVSVVSLGMGIMFVAYAFAKVASIKDDKGKPIDFKRATQVSMIMLIISGAVMLSGLILKHMPVLGISELLTVVGVGVALGLATFFLLKGFGKLKPKDLITIALAPLILPVIAGAIVLSSFILSMVEDVPFMSVMKASLAVGLSTLSILPTIYLLKKMGLLNPKALVDLTIGVGAIILISSAIAVSSHILTLGNYTDNYPTTKWAVGTGLAILAFSVPMLGVGAIIASSGGLGLLAIGAGLIAIPMISLAIVAASYILANGKYDNPVDLTWAIGTGLLLITYGATMVALGVLLPFVALGALSMMIVAWSIKDTAESLAEGKYDKYPSWEWSLSVGLSILAFGTEMVALGVVALTGFGLGFAAILAGGVAILVVAEAIQLSSHILKKGTYNDGEYPSPDWATGVGGSIMAFANALMIQQAMNMFSFFSGDVDLETFINNISTSIFLAARIFSTGIDKDGKSLGKVDWGATGTYPNEDWAKGVGGTITAFAKALQIQQELKTGFFRDESVDLSAFINKVSKAIFIAGRIFSTGIADDGTNLGKVDWGATGTYPSEDWAKGVGGTITAFAKALEIQSNSGGWFSSDIDMAEFISTITKAIVDSGKYFTENGKGMWDVGSYPTSDWVDGVSETINKIGNINVNLENFENFEDISEYLFNSAKWLSKMKNYPMGDGVNNFADAVTQIMKVLPDNNAVDPFLKLVDAFKELGDISWSDMLMISNVSESIEDIADALDDLHSDKVDSLLKLGAGFQLISLVDEKQLEKVLETLDEKAEVLKNVTDDGGYMRNMLDEMFNAFNDKTSTSGDKKSKSENKKSTGATVNKFSPYEQRMIDAVEFIADNTEKIANPKINEQETEQSSINVDD